MVIGLAPLVALALLARALFGSWVAPGAFFSLYWVAAMGAPLVFAADDRVGMVALLWVFAGAFAVSVGAHVGVGLDWEPGPAEGRQFTPGPGIRRSLGFAAVGCAVIGMGASLIPLVTQGYGFGVFTSISELVSAALELSLGRYMGTYTPPLLGQAALPFLYAGPAFGGALAAVGCRGAQQLAVVVPFVPAALLTLTQTQRAVTLGAAVIWISSYLATRVLVGRLELFSRQHVVLGALAGVLTIALAFAAMLARFGETELRALGDVVPTMLGSFFGHATVFAQWFETGGPGGTPASWGALTFAGLYDALGLGVRQPGLFAESVVLASGDETNIYTLFRLLIDDFTLVGALVALTALGALGGVAFRVVQRGYTEGVPVLAAFYATTLFGMLTSIWAYNAFLAAFVIFGAGSLVSGYYQRRRRAMMRGGAGEPV